MTRAQQQRGILALLIVVMVIVYARAFRSPTPSTSARASVERHTDVVDAPDVAEAVVTVAPEIRAAQRESQRQRTAQLTWGERDPFRQQPSETADELTLSGILWDPREPMALINDHMVRVGEEIDGHRIIEITRQRVTLSDSTGTRQLLLTP